MRTLLLSLVLCLAAAAQEAPTTVHQIATAENDTARMAIYYDTDSKKLTVVVQFDSADAPPAKTGEETAKSIIRAAQNAAAALFKDLIKAAKDGDDAKKKAEEKAKDDTPRAQPIPMQGSKTEKPPVLF